MRASAKSNSTHSMRVEARIAKASPLRTPSASSPWASSSTARPASAHETGRQPLSSSTRYAVSPAQRATASCHILVIVRVPVAVVVATVRIVVRCGFPNAPATVAAARVHPYRFHSFEVLEGDAAGQGAGLRPVHQPAGEVALA